MKIYHSFYLSSEIALTGLYFLCIIYYFAFAVILRLSINWKSIKNTCLTGMKPKTNLKGTSILQIAVYKESIIFPLINENIYHFNHFQVSFSVLYIQVWLYKQVLYLFLRLVLIEFDISRQCTYVIYLFCIHSIWAVKLHWLDYISYVLYII
jgi:hypothetical protein